MVLPREASRSSLLVKHDLFGKTGDHPAIQVRAGFFRIMLVIVP
jgi:hypothetical protein